MSDAHLNNPSATTSMAFPGMGSVISTSRTHADLSFTEQTAWVAERFGSAAHALVVATAIDLNMPPDEVIDLLTKSADPTFTEACARHLAGLRAKAQRDREQRIRNQEAADRRNQINSLESAIGNVSQLLESHEAKRRMVLVSVRAAPNPPDALKAKLASTTASLDAELAELTGMLDRAVAARDAWHAAEAERVAAPRVDEPAPKRRAR